MLPSFGNWPENTGVIPLPTLFKLWGYLIYFWSNEGMEPIHVHITKGVPKHSDTKVWIGPIVHLAHNKGQIPDKDLRRLLRFIAQNKEMIIEEWNQHWSR